MDVTCSTDPSLKGTVVALVGHLDLDGSAQAREAVLPWIVPESPSLLLDLRGVDWMSSAGVRVLMQFLARVQGHGGRFAVVGCAPRVRSILQICGLEAVFALCGSDDEARERLKSKTA
ncbi:MAG TPA: STAS domain-containing protein [Candidatus Krumholzibacteria bacterium]|nr:STAS domain-containing protein [Candidatus Krumholzibacteria bacterium]